MIPQLNLDRFEPSNLRAHYEDVAANTLGSIARHVRLIIAVVAIALVSASLLVSQLPRSYSSEALVRPDLFRSEEATKYMPLASIDGASLVSSEASLIRSPSMVRTVIKRLELDRDPEFVAASAEFIRGLSRVRAAILPETAVATSPLERATARVRQRLTVATDTRSYLISISFTAGSPEKAVKVANAFALEYVRAKTVQRLGDAVTAASRELTRRSAIYGERHPSIAQVRTELEAAHLRLQTAISHPEDREIGQGDGITLAEPNPTPSGPRGVVILGLTFLVAAASSLGLALLLDRGPASYRRDAFSDTDASRADGQNAQGCNDMESRGSGNKTGATAQSVVRA